MDPIFIKGIQLFLSLSILIILHEFGHFIPARIFGIRVEKFFLFFDVKFALFKKKIGETVYGLGWLPLGGYVKISGMIDESMDKEQMAEEPKEWEFRSKPAWQRLIIMLGGVTVNIIVGFLIYILIIASVGKPYTPAEDLPNGLGVSPIMEKYGFQQGDVVLAVNGEPQINQLQVPQLIMVRDVETMTVRHANGSEETLTIPEDLGLELFQEGEHPGFNAQRYPVVLDSIAKDGGAKNAGLLPSDELVALNGVPLEYRSDFTYALQKNRDTTDQQRDTIAQLTILRDGVQKTLDVNLGEKYQVGVYFQVPEESMPKSARVEEFTFGQSITEGVSYGYWVLHDYVAQFKYVFTAKGATQVGGFGAIAGLFPPVWDWISFWETTALISIILAFMNILPIPALDGGHVMFLLYEIVSGRKPSDKFLEYAQMIGFFLLIALVLFANGNDIYRAITGG
ncbi:MAG: RIP metalloprotease RseP [Leeuwenhoekiella sp.]